MDSKYTQINNLEPCSSSFGLKRKFPQLIGGNSQNTGSNLKFVNKKIRSEHPQNIATRSPASNQSNGSTASSNPNVVPSISIDEQRKNLPAYFARTHLLQSILKNETIILLGETGSGKTTQVPQFIYESGLVEQGLIGITQPRRVAAITIARRVAAEKLGACGELVGYSVRFENLTSDKTKIKFMTDGTLLREALEDRLLKKYRVIILDEAHERTINTDVLFGIIKEAQKIRKEKNLVPLKIIIMSATMDVDQFSNYFNSCPVFFLPGRTFPVQIFHAKLPQTDYAFAAIATLFDVHQRLPPDHHVLIFLTGQEEIEAMAHKIRQIAKSDEVQGSIRVFPLYSALPHNKQLEVFAPVGLTTRKVILATNIAETSITINGIKVVIDTGVVKRRTFDAVTGMDSLKIVKISQAQAWQRTGRAGRESAGICYRTYTNNEYDNLEENAEPEIKRCNLSAAALQLLALGIDCANFDFMDMPPHAAIISALKDLKQLGAIKSEQDPTLTDVGRKMAQFPLDPKYGKILLMAPKYHCLHDMIDLISVLSVENIIITPHDSKYTESAKLAQNSFKSPFGDHLTVLNMFKQFQKVEGQKLFCKNNWINIRNLLFAKSVKDQLSDICIKLHLPMGDSNETTDVDQVRKCLITGLFNNIAEYQERDNNYTTLGSRQRATIHPSSVLNDHNRDTRDNNSSIGSCQSKNIHQKAMPPSYIIFTELVMTSKIFMRNLSIIEPEWVQEVIPDSGLCNKMNIKNFGLH